MNCARTGLWGGRVGNHRLYPALVLTRWPARIRRPPASIGDELALLVVDRDYDPAVHNALAAVVPQPEYIDRRF